MSKYAFVGGKVMTWIVVLHNLAEFPPRLSLNTFFFESYPFFGEDRGID